MLTCNSNESVNSHQNSETKQKIKSYVLLSDKKSYTENDHKNDEDNYDTKLTNQEIKKNELFLNDGYSIFGDHYEIGKPIILFSEKLSSQFMFNKFNSLALQKENAKADKQENCSSFPLSVDCLITCFCFLTFEEIMKTQILCKFFRSTVLTALGTISNCKSLVLNSKWAKLPYKQRQFYLRQLKDLHHLTVFNDAFLNDGMVIHEVASLVAQNVGTLRSLQLFSPESPLLDSTQRHDPFEFVPLQFPHLKKLTMEGCQVLEWLHIFGNCDFKLVEQFEVCYYPISHSHLWWNSTHDFTNQGIHGMHKMIDTMDSLERLTVGFDLWFEASTKPYPIEALKNGGNIGTIQNNELEYDSILFNGIISEDTEHPPVGGYGICQSYRGKLSEEDFSDIFTIAFSKENSSKYLKKIVIKYRLSETKAGSSEEANPIFDFFESATSYCGKYISDVIAKMRGN